MGLLIEPRQLFVKLQTSSAKKSGSVASIYVNVFVKLSSDCYCWKWVKIVMEVFVLGGEECSGRRQRWDEKIR
mgnify:CR=1 FL=1